MKNVLLLLLLFFFFSLQTSAQDESIKNLQSEADKEIKKDPNDTLPKTWKKGAIININLSQGSLSNWAAGGDNYSLSLNSYLGLYAFYKKERHSWDNTLDVNFGYVNTTSLGSRKNDDRVDLLSKYGYALNKNLNISGLFNFRTQMAKGYTYDHDIKTLASAFLSPAYILLSPGFDYHPVKDFSIFISPATIRWVIVNNDSLSARGEYGVAPGKKSRSEFGAFATINYLKNLNKTVSYKGRLDLFSNYKHNPQNVDLYMTNLFAARIAKALSVTWSVDLIYDDDARLFGKNKDAPRLQFKSLIGVGLLLNL